MTKAMPTFRERSQARYDALPGALYDFAIERPEVARVAARAMWGADVEVFYSALDAVREAPEGITILDVPCGGGVALARLPRGRRVRYLAVDASPGMLERAGRVAKARSIEGVELVEADVGALPFADASVDLCVTSAGLHCFPDPARAVAEMARCLRPGGRLVGSMVVAAAGARHDALMATFRRLALFGPGGTSSDLERWLREASMRDVELTRSGALVGIRATRA